jgi:hypothetical protein
MYLAPGYYFVYYLVSKIDHKNRSKIRHKNCLRLFNLIKNKEKLVTSVKLENNKISEDKHMINMADISQH